MLYYVGLPYFLSTGVLEKALFLLLSYSTTKISSHIIVILIITPTSFNRTSTGQLVNCQLSTVNWSIGQLICIGASEYCSTTEEREREENSPRPICWCVNMVPYMGYRGSGGLGLGLSLYCWSRIRPAQIQAQVRGWMFWVRVISLYCWHLVSC